MHCHSSCSFIPNLHEASDILLIFYFNVCKPQEGFSLPGLSYRTASWIIWHTKRYQLTAKIYDACWQQLHYYLKNEVEHHFKETSPDIIKEFLWKTSVVMKASATFTKVFSRVEVFLFVAWQERNLYVTGNPEEKFSFSGKTNSNFNNNRYYLICFDNSKWHFKIILSSGY